MSELFTAGHLDSPYVLKLRHIRATKKCHRCIWCGGAIRINHQAVYRVTTYDEFQSDYWHAECWAVQVDLEDYTFMPYMHPFAAVDYDNIFPPSW